MSVDPITGLPNGEDVSQETTSNIPLRPQSPLVRGSHLDKSTERFKKRSRISHSVDNDHFQQPAKPDELHGFVPPLYEVVNLRDKVNHIADVVKCVIEGKEEFVSEEELLLTQPLNLEKTRFTMSKKKLKLQFIDDVLDRFEDERWLFPEQFERKRKLWHKSVARSLKVINTFLDKEPMNDDYVRPKNRAESFGDTTIESGSTHVSTTKSRRGKPKTAKTVMDATVVPKRRGRKSKEKTAEDGVDILSKLTHPAPKQKIPKKAAVKTDKPSSASASESSAKKPTFTRKKNDGEKKVVLEQNALPKEKKKRTKKNSAEGEDCDASSSKKSKQETTDDGITNATTKKARATKTNKPAFGPKRGKKAMENDPTVEEEASTEQGRDTDTAIKEKDIIAQKESSGVESRVSEKKKPEEIAKIHQIYDNIDEDEELRDVGSQKCPSQSITVPVIPASIRDDGMETDDEDWEPNTPRELTPPRGLLSTSQDPILHTHTYTSYPSYSSQSLFESLNSSLISSPNVSLSSQNSLLTAPTTFNLSSSLIPSEPLATSTQIPLSQPLHNNVEKEKEEKEKPTPSGSRVKPTFRRKK